jgi:hypothetical protein
LFTVFFRRRDIATGGETVAAAKAVIKGPCPRLISFRPLLRPCKGKRFASSGYKSYRMYCTRKEKRTEERKKIEGEGNVRKRETEGGKGEKKTT